MSYLDEARVEIVTVDYFRELGYAHIHGPVIAPDGEAPERVDYAQVAPKSTEWHSYVLSLASSKAFVDYTDSHSAGTKMPRTNWKDMGRHPLALPPEPLAKVFQDHVAALHQRIGLAVRQNRRWPVCATRCCPNS